MTELLKYRTRDLSRLQLVAEDPLLLPYLPYIEETRSQYKSTLDRFNAQGGLLQSALSYRDKCIHTDDHGCIIYQEWAPNATDAFLIGDFNAWNRSSHPMTRNGSGVFSIRLEPNTIPHGTKYKISLLVNGTRLERVPAWATYAVQSPGSVAYDAVFWNPPNSYKFQHPKPVGDGAPLIYEAHVGISTPEPRIGTYIEFAKNIIPRIAALGYNTVQLMAIVEHPYYASFGYQVTSLFAVSSRYGTPEDFKFLVDEAHKHGLKVLLDIVHSHASKNVADGLNMFDGTDDLYFVPGPRGRHPAWDSRLFDYSKIQVLTFLLSNLRFFMDVYNVDGFRFDGVTSMIYHHHGLGKAFTSYDDYFSAATNRNALVYLMLANDLVHSLDGITISEDMSGMPGMCRTIHDGGIGFDYRLGMALPDMWINMVKNFVSDLDWNMGHICYELENRRAKEKTIAYAESHDQSLVGDKTLAFWLMDAEMYTNMSDLSERTSVIDRGISLHKMIRLITQSLGGEGYLNFEGNEFGHPEWLDFPRFGNHESYQYARRQFNLVDDPLLRYKYLNRFDAAMNSAARNLGFLTAPPACVSRKDESDKVIAYERGPAVFVFNFHPFKSYASYAVGVSSPGTYVNALSSDEPAFGGHGNIDTSVRHFTMPKDHDGHAQHLSLYLPSRTCQILIKET